MRELQRVIDPLQFTLAAEQMVRGGQSGEGGALDFGLPEGVAAKHQGRIAGGDEAWFGVGLRDPTVAPAGEGGRDHGGCEVRAETVARERDQGVYDLCLVFLEVRAAPLRSRVYCDGRDPGDAFAPVVADPIQRLALDLHPSWLRYTARAVEHDHKSEARIVGDSLELAPCLIRQPVTP